MDKPTAYLVTWPGQNPNTASVHLADDLPLYYEQHALSVVTPLYPPSEREQQLEKIIEEGKQQIARLQHLLDVEIRESLRNDAT